MGGMDDGGGAWSAAGGRCGLWIWLVVDVVVDVDFMMSAARPYAVFAVDPGGTSGVARGVFVNQGSLAATLRGHRLEAWEVEGEPEEQAWEIAAEFLDWAMDLRAHRIPDVDFVSEAFHLRQRSADLSPVEVMSGVKALLIPRATALETGEPHVRPFWSMVEQTASEAKSFATSARLRQWGLFALGRGSDHKRDATRHLAYRVAARGG
jgi:hypothetical protein